MSERSGSSVPSGSNMPAYSQLPKASRIPHERPSDGAATLRSWTILPGVSLVSMEFDTTESFAEEPCKSNLIDIRYCLDGASEMQMLNRSVFRLREGELCVHTLTNKAASYSFPQGRFLGIELLIDPDSLTEETKSCFSLFDIDLKRLSGAVSSGPTKDIWFHGMAPRSIRQIAEDMVYGDAASSPAYLRLKALELLFQAQRLSGSGVFDPAPRSDRAADVANRTRELLMENLGRTTSLQELLKQSGVGERTARNAFRKVYGCTVGTFLRRARMDEAARLLAKGEAPIGTIAGMVGYASASKFSSAFKREYEMLPKDYRDRYLR